MTPEEINREIAEKGMNNYLNEICLNCGLTLGSHSGDSYYSDFYKIYIPKNYCPGHEAHMDWDKGTGSMFNGSGEFKRIPPGTPAKGVLDPATS